MINNAAGRAARREEAMTRARLMRAAPVPPGSATQGPSPVMPAPPCDECLAGVELFQTERREPAATRPPTGPNLVAPRLIHSGQLGVRHHRGAVTGVWIMTRSSGMDSTIDFRELSDRFEDLIARAGAGDEVVMTAAVLLGLDPIFARHPVSVIR